MILAELFATAMHPTSGWATAAEIGGVFLAVVAFVGGVIAVTKAMTHLKNIALMVTGRPAAQGVEAVPSMVERFEEGDKRFTEIEQHLAKQDGEQVRLRNIVTNGLSDGVKDAIEISTRNGKLIEAHIANFDSAETQAAIVAAATAAAHQVIQHSDS